MDRFLDLLTAHDTAAATAMFTEGAELIAVVELRDGRITRFTEYFNPDALRAAGVI